MDQIPEEQEHITEAQLEQAAKAVFELFEDQEGLLIHDTEDSKLFLSCFKTSTEPLPFLLKICDVVATMLSECFIIDFTAKDYKFANVTELHQHLREQIVLLMLRSLPVAPVDDTTESKGVGSGLLN